MINDISLKNPASQDAFSADWFRSRARYQEAARQIQQKTDQVREGMNRQLDETMRRAGDDSNVFRTQLSFDVRQDNRVVLRIVNTETNQVIRQIPSESMLRVSEEIQKIIGTFVDRKA